MVKDEVEPLGGFIGDAFVQPAFLGSQALTAHRLHPDAELLRSASSRARSSACRSSSSRGCGAGCCVLGRQRQLAARQLAGRIGEIVDGIDRRSTSTTPSN